MMLVGLHDAEQEYLRGKTFPNYALMKISTYHKNKGDVVAWWTEIESEKYDLIYSSKIFDFTRENPYLPERTIKGGTGYNIKTKLPYEIDALFPDYTIYPQCDYALGYITRGCNNNCAWCIVPEKEGHIAPYRRWRDIVRVDRKKLVLMDNNILAHKHGITELESLIGSGYSIDLNQGMDACLIDNSIAGILSRLTWIKYIRLSCDTLQKVDAVISAAEKLKYRGIPAHRIFVYMLITHDIQDAVERVKRLRVLKNITLYAQPERSNARNKTPNREQLTFAQRYIYSGVYRKKDWDEWRKAE